MTTIAVLSDTHGLLRPEIPSAIKDVDHIIHAGDLGKSHVCVVRLARERYIVSLDR